jgi:hypothetical protein
VPLLLLLLLLPVLLLQLLLLLLLLLLLAPLLLLLMLRQVLVQWGMEAPQLDLAAGPSAALPAVPTVMDDPPDSRLAPSEGEFVVQRSVDEIVPRLATPMSPRGEEPATYVSCGGGD